MDITLYTRPHCHLCDDAKALLRALSAGKRLVVREVCVDDDPEWVAKYGDMVPVIEVAGRPRLWGKIEAAWLRRLLDAEAR